LVEQLCAHTRSPYAVLMGASGDMRMTDLVVLAHAMERPAGCRGPTQYAASAVPALEPVADAANLDDLLAEFARRAAAATAGGPE